MNCDTETGISIMKIIPELDAGPVLLKSKIKITKETNYKELSDEMSKLGSKLILEALDLIKNDKAIFDSQNDKEATYAKKIEKSESKINWNLKAKTLVAKVNAFFPNPGSWFVIKGIRIKIIRAIEVKGKGMPGEVINENFTIACSQNALQVLELQKEGKKKITAIEYLKGNKLKIGSNILTDV